MDLTIQASCCRDFFEVAKSEANPANNKAARLTSKLIFSLSCSQHNLLHRVHPMLYFVKGAILHCTLMFVTLYYMSLNQSSGVDREILLHASRKLACNKFEYEAINVSQVVRR